MRLKIGVSEFSTAAVPESMYCSPQVIRKNGSAVAIIPSAAMGSHSRTVRGSFSPVEADVDEHRQRAEADPIGHQRGGVHLLDPDLDPQERGAPDEPE